MSLFLIIPEYCTHEDPEIGNFWKLAQLKDCDPLKIGIEQKLKDAKKALKNIVVLWNLDPTLKYGENTLTIRWMHFFHH